MGITANLMKVRLINCSINADLRCKVRNRKTLFQNFAILFYFKEMHITGHKLDIVVIDDGTTAKVTIPEEELIVFGDDHSYFICLNSVS